VPTRIRRGGQPTPELIKPETAVTTRVSPSDPKSRSSGRLGVAEDLHTRAPLHKIAFDLSYKVG
jgi:hypothetical protein